MEELKRLLRVLKDSRMSKTILKEVLMLLELLKFPETL